jgi:hypothetical protein
LDYSIHWLQQSFMQGCCYVGGLLPTTTIRYRYRDWITARDGGFAPHRRSVTDVVAVQSPQSWALVVYLGVIPTAFAYWIFQIGLKTVSATTASIVVLIDPVVAAGLAWLLFGENLTLHGMDGGGLTTVEFVDLGNRVDERLRIKAHLISSAQEALPSIFGGSALKRGST